MWRASSSPEFVTLPDVGRIGLEQLRQIDPAGTAAAIAVAAGANLSGSRGRAPPASTSAAGRALRLPPGPLQRWEERWRGVSGRDVPPRRSAAVAAVVGSSGGGATAGASSGTGMRSIASRLGGSSSTSVAASGRQEARRIQASELRSTESRRAAAELRNSEQDVDFESLRGTGGSSHFEHATREALQLPTTPVTNPSSSSASSAARLERNWTMPTRQQTIAPPRRAPPRLSATAAVVANGTSTSNVAGAGHRSSTVAAGAQATVAASAVAFAAAAASAAASAQAARAGPSITVSSSTSRVPPHESSNADEILELPDVGRVSRRQLRQLEAAFAGDEEAFAAASNEAPPARQTIAELAAGRGSRPSTPGAGLVDIPEVGVMAEDDLRRLEQFLDTSDAGSSTGLVAEALPDLTGLSSRQLRRLSAVLGSSAVNSALELEQPRRPANRGESQPSRETAAVASASAAEAPASSQAAPSAATEPTTVAPVRSSSSSAASAPFVSPNSGSTASPAVVSSRPLAPSTPGAPGPRRGAGSEDLAAAESRASSVSASVPAAAMRLATPSSASTPATRLTVSAAATPQVNTPVPPSPASTTSSSARVAASLAAAAAAAESVAAEAEPLEAQPQAGRDGEQQTGKKWLIDETAFEKLKISSGSLAAGQYECSICYSEVEDKAVSLPCGSRNGCSSVFHVQCIRPWLERNPSCPLCRCELKEVATPIPEPARRSSGVSGPLFMMWMSALAEEFEALQVAAATASAARAAMDAQNLDDLHQARRAFLGRHREAMNSLQNLQGVVLPAGDMVEILRLHGVTDVEAAGVSGGLRRRSPSPRDADTPPPSRPLPRHADTPPASRPFQGGRNANDRTAAELEAARGLVAFAGARRQARDDSIAAAVSAAANRGDSGPFVRFNRSGELLEDPGTLDLELQQALLASVASSSRTRNRRAPRSASAPGLQPRSPTQGAAAANAARGNADVAENDVM
eukprot:TRINITY_DN56336_c0_g1_i1.p1 TRINITY_DN56336_c0_g1~~TRINITY_DN56336_c0_g1_i1.p1  ORF type:complete len:978 (+),score=188.84 TRINITY_DN56336_c0_g1_i1:172-3105(+)